MEFVPFLVLIMLIAVLCLAFMRLFSSNLPGEGGRSGSGPSTKLMPYLYLEQLDPETMKAYKRFSMDEFQLEDSGFTVSGSVFRTGDIRLSGKFEQAEGVSCEHITIWKDDKGCFVVDNGSSNGTRFPESRERIERADIEHGMVLYLGPQPVRFVFAKQEGKDVPNRKPHTQIFTHSRRSPVDAGAADRKTQVFTGDDPRIRRRTEPVEFEEKLNDEIEFRKKPVRRNRPTE